MRVEGKQLRRRFGEVHALRGIDFTIPSGSRLGLVGPNASGKSTLIRIILGLVRSEGELLLDGSSERGSDVAARMAYVPQIAPRFSAGVGEVVRAIAQVRSIEPEVIVSFGRALSIDLQEVRRQPFKTLSGGAKQKVMLALALASNASLLVLDEPTASLDAKSRACLFEQIDHSQRDATLILCSHRLEEIRTLVDQVMVLEEGELAFLGPTEAYLDRITLSTIEVRMLNGSGDAVLTRLGFAQQSTGWWSRTATREEKLALVTHLSEEMAGHLSNLVVRDADAIQSETEEGSSD